MKVFVLFLLVLAGCASNQIPFQKSDIGVGYSVEAKGSGNFLVKTNLPSDFEPKSVERYVARAVGEECLHQGFQYFDYTTPTKGMSEGFCFKENKRKALAITFEKDGLAAAPPTFIVENLNQKSKTNILVGDKVIKAEGRNVTSVSDLKRLAFHCGQKGTENISLEIIRQGKPLILSEPLAEFSNGAHGPDSLESLQKKYY